MTEQDVVIITIILGIIQIPSVELWLMDQQKGAAFNLAQLVFGIFLLVMDFRGGLCVVSTAYVCHVIAALLMKEEK